MTYNDWKNAFKMELCEFILSINPQFSKDKNPISFNGDNLYNLEVYLEDYTKDEIKDMFYETWDNLNLNKEFLSKKEGFEFFIKYVGNFNSINLNSKYYELFWKES